MKIQNKNEKVITYTCRWCGDKFTHKPTLANGYITFCGYNCRNLWYDHYHTNTYSDADPGL